MTHTNHPGDEHFPQPLLDAIRQQEAGTRPDDVVHIPRYEDQDQYIDRDGVVTPDPPIQCGTATQAAAAEQHVRGLDPEQLHQAIRELARTERQWFHEQLRQMGRIDPEWLRDTFRRAARLEGTAY